VECFPASLNSDGQRAVHGRSDDQHMWAWIMNPLHMVYQLARNHKRSDMRLHFHSGRLVTPSMTTGLNISECLYD